MKTKTSTLLKKGMKILIYSDPLTKQKLEGLAELDFHENVADADHLQYWSVRFVNEEGWFTRWVDPFDKAETI